MENGGEGEAWVRRGATRLMHKTKPPRGEQKSREDDGRMQDDGRHIITHTSASADMSTARPREKEAEKENIQPKGQRQRGGKKCKENRQNDDLTPTQEYDEFKKAH